jgi:hypothetical protein
MEFISMHTIKCFFICWISGLRIKVNAIRREMQQLMEGMETADVPAPERRTNVEPIDKTKPGQENLSEKPTPKELLPP